MRVAQEKSHELPVPGPGRQGPRGLCQCWSKEATASTRCILRGQRGFSLTELLVAMAVMGLLLGGILAIQQQGLTAYVMGSNRVETQQNARVALDLMIREVRSATTVDALASATDITFQGACKPPPDTTDYPIRYHLSSAASDGRSILNRTCDNLEEPLIGGIDAASFRMTYWSAYDPTNQNEPNTQFTTDPLQVRVIRIRLTTRTEEQAASGSAGDRRAVMESTVRLRNVP